MNFPFFIQIFYLSLVLLHVDFAMAAPGSFSGNIEDDYLDGNGGNLAAGLVLFAIVAFVIHLIEKGEIFSFLQDVAKSISFIATIYLTAFWFLTPVVGLALLLQSFGVEKGISGIIALPVGLFVAYKLFPVYEAWRGAKR